MIISSLPPLPKRHSHRTLAEMPDNVVEGEYFFLLSSPQL